jgi:predicted nucleotidyltransferase
VIRLPQNPAQHHLAADAAAERLRELAERHLPHARLWIFGSRAKGTYFRRSDFDVAVEPAGGEFDSCEYHRFLEAVEEEATIPYRVDVHLMTQIPESWRETIRKEGVLWKN